MGIEEIGRCAAKETSMVGLARCAVSGFAASQSEGFDPTRVYLGGIAESRLRDQFLQTIQGHQPLEEDWYRLVSDEGTEATPKLPPLFTIEEDPERRLYELVNHRITPVEFTPDETLPNETAPDETIPYETIPAVPRAMIEGMQAVAKLIAKVERDRIYEAAFTPHPPPEKKRPWHLKVLAAAAAGLALLVALFAFGRWRSGRQLQRTARAKGAPAAAPARHRVGSTKHPPRPRVRATKASPDAASSRKPPPGSRSRPASPARQKERPTSPTRAPRSRASKPK